MIGERGKINGAAILWNQNKYKRIVIEDYSFPVKLLKPLYNAFSSMRGRPQLYRTPWTVENCFAFGAIVKNNDPCCFKALIDACLEEAGIRNFRYVIIGLPESDPLTPILKTYKAIIYKSSLYHLSYKEQALSPGEPALTYDSALL